MTQSQNSQTVFLYISGAVQGVGYRRFAQKVAERMKLTGWVRNLTDGRVQILVASTGSELEEFIRQLKLAPPPGKVVAIEKQEGPNGPIEGFSIAPTA